ncbi:unnamed protein product [Cylicocyclus nassatus]|uniref:Uncharacterized protein n=1 Tax=Cylicocyclus nassatus TaxID=53992 RepID=A0AA36H6L0_CYLNA|nr:unnamed protein product [Cylicocyclus nassatus]
MRWHDIISKAVVFLISVIVWRLSLRLLSQRIPSFSGRHKYFSKRLINDDDALNRHRLNISKHMYSQLRKQSDHFSPLEIRIIASDRRQSYLSQVITFLVDAYQSQKQLSPSLEICNVEPEIFEELRQFQLHVPVRTIGRRSSRSSTLDEIIVKEALDYWKCLNRTTKKRYVLLLEDDALVIPDFARMLSSLVEQLDVHDRIDYVKMYHPNHLRKIPSIPLGITLCFVFCCTYCFAIYRRVLLCWILVTSIILFLELRSYGSQFIADLRYHLTKTTYMSSTESCCTPAVLFRTSKIEEIVLELNEETRKNARVGHAKDHILDESRFVGRQTDMNLVVHIGAYSSVRKRKIKLD